MAWKALYNLHKCALFTNPLLKWSYSSSVLPIQVYPRTSNPSYNHTIGQYCLTLYPIEISELRQAACLAIKHTSSIFGVFLSYIFLPLHSVGNHSSWWAKVRISVEFSFLKFNFTLFSYSNTIYEFASVKVLKSSTIICVCVYWSLCVCLFLFLLQDITFIASIFPDILNHFSSNKFARSMIKNMTMMSYVSLHIWFNHSLRKYKTEKHECLSFSLLHNILTEI